MLRAHRLLLLGSVTLGVAVTVVWLWPRQDESSETASLRATSTPASVAPALMPAEPSGDELAAHTPRSPVAAKPKAELPRAPAPRVVQNDAPAHEPTVTERLLERDRLALGVFEETVARATPNSLDSPAARLVELERDRLNQRIAQRQRTLRHEHNQQAQ